MDINEIKEGDLLRIVLSGRIDTATAPKFQEAILKAFQKTNNLILDFEKVDYISSAGLRALLLGQKTAMSKQATMKLINVGDVVMQVLKISNFISMLTVE